MSKISNVENGAVYEGYDSLAASEWCTPSFLGCSACISASAVKGQVTITIGLKTPFGSVNKSFSFNTNTSFTWQPFSKFKIAVSITNFNEASGVFSFDLGLNPCIDVPFLGWKCFNYSHTFTVPLLLAGIESDIDDSQFVSLLTLHASGSLNAPCQCDDHSGSSLLKGDIYSNYLNNQAGAANFPTIPLTSCFTGIPIVCAYQAAAAGGNTANLQGDAANFPTIPVFSCITGVPIVCALQAAAGNTANVQADAANFPTIPVFSCITGVPIVCALQAQAAGGNAANLQANTANFPTIPVFSCITGVPIVCALQAQAAGGTAANLQANTANFPTIPVFSCITGVPIVCALQAQAAGGNAANLQANTANFPTIPITSCITGIPIVCAYQAAAAAGGNTANLQANTANFPTIPITSCITGIPIVCAYQAAAGNTSVNQPATLPTIAFPQCFPTGISCLPTTGIPYICR
ncbi:hypothetical protein [Flavobacterium sp. 1355]|uniref:hypothetical protein n=1 Tax=Flavobacterium sp. 1355 TaxID=2806571 RepID=UPI001AE9B161|nr:hypothetical protein [Flavobacterium sp. 1355]MBP1224423.1 hypothetical protein [Flavobacterium sp. 1355]